MLTIKTQAKSPKASTTLIDVQGDTAELSEAIQVMAELGWDQELLAAAPLDNDPSSKKQARFVVENSMIAEFKHDLEATKSELLKAGDGPSPE